MFTTKTPWVILLFLWMAGSAWWHVCQIKQLCADDDGPVAMLPADTEVYTTPPGADGFTIADGNRFQLEFPGNFSFAKSGANANINTLGGTPLGGTPLGGRMDSLVTYLKANPDRTLDVRGYYMASETNTTSFANLGLARAEGIKQYLIQQGVSAASLMTTGVLRNVPLTTKGDSLIGGLDFVFGGLMKMDAIDTLTTTSPAPLSIAAGITEEGLAARETYTSVFEPINLYFPLSKADYIKTPETTKFFDEAAKYLKANKDKKLMLTGYTDNSGPDDANLVLSRKRAADVKTKMRNSGISADQIMTEGRGEANPVASNETREGRKANRRVNVVVK